MTYSKAIAKPGIDYFLVDYFIYNLLLDMADGETDTGNRSDPSTVLKTYSFVDYSKSVNLQTLSSVFSLDRDLLITFAFDPAATENSDPQRDLGASCEFHPFNRVYQIYLTMRSSDENRDLLNKLTTIIVQNLTYNDVIYTPSLVDSEGNSVDFRSNLFMNELTSEPILVNEFEGIANYMTSTFTIKFNIYKQQV